MNYKEISNVLKITCAIDIVCYYKRSELLDILVKKDVHTLKGLDAKDSLYLSRGLALSNIKSIMLMDYKDFDTCFEKSLYFKKDVFNSIFILVINSPRRLDLKVANTFIKKISDFNNIAIAFKSYINNNDCVVFVE